MEKCRGLLCIQDGCAMNGRVFTLFQLSDSKIVSPIFLSFMNIHFIIPSPRIILLSIYATNEYI